MEGVELEMDLYYPGKVDRPAPAIVYLHGGGWSSGDKREAERIWEILKYFPNPYVLVSVNYRLAPAYRFPAQIVDVKCAIRHLRANSGHYQIDPQRIGVMGASAGGHLAALLGLSDESAGWDAGENLDQSSRVKAVVVVASPADFTRDFPGGSRAIAKSVFGVTDRSDPMLQYASPVTYISAGDPPFLILQGEKDDQVPVEQARLLYNQLRKAGVPADLVLIKNAGHSLRPVGGAMSPSQLEVALKIARFFSENL
jgi:acetyl esterase/lipase